MRKIPFILLLSLLTVFYSCGKDDDEPTAPQPSGNVAAFYPGNTGSVFSYAISIDNVPVGSRLVTIGGTTTLKGKAYTVQNSFIQFGTDTSSATTYFRMSADTLFYFIDTTGLYRFIPPDFSGINIRATDEIKMLGVPLNSGNAWLAYKLTASLGIFSFDVFELRASYLGKENITLNLTSGQQSKSAEKIQYQMKITLPDSTNLTTPRSRTYNAQAWFVDGVGLARVEGNAAVINALSSTSIDFSDTSRTAVQAINSYTIK